MSLVSTMQDTFTILSPLIPGAILYGTYAGIGYLKQKGYKTTYLDALPRAAAAGMAAAQAGGLNPFSKAGLAVAGDIGGKYLMANVPDAIKNLAIGDAEHAGKVVAEVQTYQAQAMADAASAAASNDKSVLQMAASVGQGILPGLSGVTKPSLP